MSKIKRVMYDTDFSSASQPALARAIEMARATRARLLVVHALTITVPFLVGTYLSPRAVQEFKDRARVTAHKRLQIVVAKAKKARVSAIGLIVEGEPYEQIVRVARLRKADLLVIGTHGRTGLPRLILGSVAGRVVVTAPCAVLTVRGR